MSTDEGDRPALPQVSDPRAQQAWAERFGQVVAAERFGRPSRRSVLTPLQDGPDAIARRRAVLLHIRRPRSDDAPCSTAGPASNLEG